jgi:hypothetical protein
MYKPLHIRAEVLDHKLCLKYVIQSIDILDDNCIFVSI